MKPSTQSLRRPAVVAAAVALVPLVVLLAACGGGSGGGGSVAGGPSSAPSGSGQPQGQGQGNQNGRTGQGGAAFPAASGLIAAVSPGVLEVQGTDAQTTVTYTGATRFTQTVPGSLAAGDCVLVSGTPVTGSSDALTATSVRIEAMVGGACPTATGGAGGAFGGPDASGSPRGGFGSGAPRPSGAPSGGFAQRSFALATGTVSAVSGSTVTVRGVLREGRPTASPSTTPTTITVTLAAGATVTRTVATTSAAATVGRCAAATGTTNDRGDLAATSVMISPADAGGCRGGFGGFGRGPGAGSGTGTGTGTNA